MGVPPVPRKRRLLQPLPQPERQRARRGLPLLPGSHGPLAALRPAAQLVESTAMRAAIACLLVLLPVAPAGAADIYRWVDENGKVHMSDVVPEKYRKSAKRIGSPSEVSPAQREEAEARAAADRARAT